MDAILQDLRYAYRQLRRDAGSTAVILLTVALGIGATTAVFSVVDGVLLRPLPFEESERLVWLARMGDTEADLSIPDGRDLREGTTAFESLGLFMPFWAFDLTGQDEPERLNGALVEPQLFGVLRVSALRGRVLRAGDNAVGGAPVAVISEGLWRRRFGGDPDIVGRAVTLSDRLYTIVGVVPGRVDFLEAGTEVWAPVAVEAPWAMDERGTNNMEAVARLRDGAELEAARAEILALTERLAAAYPATNIGKILRPLPLGDVVVGDVRPALVLLLGVVILVLLIASGNVAGLLLVRATRRRHEVGIRLALGGSRWRLARLMLIESLILSLAGGALGVAVAAWSTDALIALAPAGVPRAAEIGLDSRVLIFAAAVTVLTGLAFGAAPALQAGRNGSAELIREGGSRTTGSRQRQRFLNGLVICEVALAFAVLIGAALLTRSLIQLQQVELGFDPRGVLAVNVVLPESRYGEVESQTRAFAGMVEVLEKLPEVERAGFVIGAPLTGFGYIGHSVLFDDRPPPEPGERPSARNRPVHGDYFRAMGIRILRGRGLTEDDDADAAAVAVVNETFTRMFWPDQDPIGKRVAWTGAGDGPHWMTVVGIAADVKSTSLDAGDVQTIYTSYLQRIQPWQRFGTLVAKTRADPARLARAVRGAIWSVDPDIPVESVTAMNELVNRSVSRERFSSFAVGIFGLVALVIAVQGLYGLLAYVVSQRRGEIGVRLAVGARTGDVLRMVLGRGLSLAGAGLALGALAALLLVRLISDLLYGVPTTDPLSYAAVTVIVLTTVLIGGYLPARRATRVDPVETLRRE